MEKIFNKYSNNFIHFRSKQWVTNLRQADLEKYSAEQLYKNYTMCAKHFEDSQFKNTEKKWLTAGAIPTLFDIANPPPQIHLYKSHQSDQIQSKNMPSRWKILKFCKILLLNQNNYHQYHKRLKWNEKSDVCKLSYPNKERKPKMHWKNPQNSKRHSHAWNAIFHLTALLL